MSPTPNATATSPAPTSTATNPPPSDTPSTPEPTPGECVGDCDGNGTVAVNELVTGVIIALDQAPLANCPSLDRNGNEDIEINELVRGVGNLLEGCGSD